MAALQLLNMLSTVNRGYRVLRQTNWRKLCI